jgi:hypothetical protein
VAYFRLISHLLNVSHHGVQTGSGAHPASQWVPEALSPGCKAAGM